MSLTKLELKRIFNSTLNRICIAAVLVITVIIALFFNTYGSWGISPLYTGVSGYRTIDEIREQYEYFKGEVTDEWIERYLAEEQAIIDDPNNWVSEEEQEAIRQEYRDMGYTDDYIDSLSNAIYMRDDVRANEFDLYEPIYGAVRFRTHMAEVSEGIQERYLELYPGTKGERMAQYAAELYNDIIENYRIYYNYDYGWHKLRNLQLFYPYTLGLLLLVVLSPMFSGEYSSHTDALILSSKYGKREIISAKIKAGIIFSVMMWAALELINLLLVYVYCGLQGWEAYWQDGFVTAPWKVNNLGITSLAAFTGLFGAVLMGLLTMLLSACSKNNFVSLAAGWIVWALPLIKLKFTAYGIGGNWYFIFPSQLLNGYDMWKYLDLSYIIGRPVTVQAVIIPLSAVLGICCIIFAHRRFRNHQVSS